jgi:hypothetical protein
MLTIRSQLVFAAPARSRSSGGLYGSTEQSCRNTLESEMRKIMLFGIAAVIVAAAVTAWAATAPRSKTTEVVAVGIDPLGLMKASTGLQVEAWDAF